MKKFAIKAVALAAGALAAGGVLAGTITVIGGQHNFAVEALSPVAPLTTVTMPDFRYNMGVGRPAGNGFTIINSASSGSTFGTCVIPVYAPVAARVLPHVAPIVFITLKRSGFELGTGTFINTALPEESAAFLRGVHLPSDGAEQPSGAHAGFRRHGG